MSPTRVRALLALPALLGSECSFSLGSADLPVREIVLVPSAVELPAGARAGIEAIGRDRLGGRVEVRVAWESDDPEVATVAPEFASHTVITAVGSGETRVVATHRTSGARDTVEVTVTPVTLRVSAGHTPPAAARPRDRRRDGSRIHRSDEPRTGPRDSSREPTDGRTGR